MTPIDRALLARALALPAPPLPFPLPPGALPAAVLVPVALDPPRTLLQVRARGLRDHGGELGFPGGKPEPADPDLLATALREAREEIGLLPPQTHPLGPLTVVPVITGRFVVHPFVALVEGPLSLCLSPELERVIEVPLLPWLDGSWTTHATVDTWRGSTFLTPFFRLPGGEVLYGASAVIFHDLLRRLAAAAGASLPAPVVVEEKPWGDRYGREVT